MGNTRLVFEPTAGLDEECYGRGSFSVVDCSNFYASRVNDCCKVARNSRRAAYGGRSGGEHGEEVVGRVGVNVVDAHQPVKRPPQLADGGIR